LVGTITTTTSAQQTSGGSGSTSTSGGTGGTSGGGSGGTGGSTGGPATYGSEPGQVVVRLVSATDLAAVAQQYGLDPVPIDQFRSQPIYLLSILDGSSPETKSSQLLSDNQKRITYAEPNEISQAPEGVGRVIWSGGGSVASYAVQWAGTTIRLDQAHAVSTGQGVTVAVIDTGVDMTHPALAGRLVPGYDFVDQDNDPSEVGSVGVTPMYGHGTHVAGLVALAAPGAMIMPIRALDPFGKGDTWVVAKAMAFAVDPDGDPNTKDGADIINLSMSTSTQSNLLRDVIRAVTCVNSDGGQGDLPCFQPGGRGAVVVTAAGNHSSSTLEYPAGDNLPALISVAATNEVDLLATFSNYGSWVKVGAPGDTIMSSVPGGGYAAWSGTSMATPLVSGETALVLSAFPSMTGLQAAQQVFGTSTIIGGQVSHRIDAASALGIPH